MRRSDRREPSPSNGETGVLTMPAAVWRSTLGRVVSSWLGARTDILVRRFVLDDRLLHAPIRVVPVYSLRLTATGFLTLWGWQPLRIKDANDIARLLCQLLGPLDREAVAVVMVTAERKLIGVHVASIGQPTRVAALPREIFKPAILGCSEGIYLAHNHPLSGVHPSDADIEFTKRMMSVGDDLGITVYDHLIIGEQGATWLSLKEHKFI